MISMSEIESSQKIFKKEGFSRAFYILFFGLLFLLVIRVLILRDTFEMVWDISILFLLTSVYLIAIFLKNGKLHKKYGDDEDGFDIKRSILNGFLVGFLTIIVVYFTTELDTNPLRQFFALTSGIIVFVVVWTSLDMLFHRISSNKD